MCPLRDYVQVRFSAVLVEVMLIQEGLLSVTSESMCMNFWLTAKSSLSRKKVWLGELTVQHDHSCWLGPKEPNKQKTHYWSSNTPSPPFTWNVICFLIWVAKKLAYIVNMMDPGQTALGDCSVWSGSKMFASIINVEWSVFDCMQLLQQL